MTLEATFIQSRQHCKSVNRDEEDVCLARCTPTVLGCTPDPMLLEASPCARSYSGPRMSNHLSNEAGGDYGWAAGRCSGPPGRRRFWSDPGDVSAVAATGARHGLPDDMVAVQVEAIHFPEVPPASIPSSSPSNSFVSVTRGSHETLPLHFPRETSTPVRRSVADFAHNVRKPVVQAQNVLMKRLGITSSSGPPDSFYCFSAFPGGVRGYSATIPM
jgi:hypothetical protein